VSKITLEKARAKMKALLRWPIWISVIIAIIGISLPAKAIVSNGDFEAPSNPFEDWNYYTSGSPSYIGTVDHYGSYYSTIAHLHAQANYTWDGYQWLGSDGYVQLDRFPDHVVTTGQNETILQFEAARILNGEDLEDPTVTVIVSDSPDPNWWGWTNWVNISSPEWQTYQIPLWDDPSNPLPAGSELEIFIEVITNQPYRDGTVGEQVTQTVDLYVDNFVLVPLPGTLLWMLSGGTILLRRRRR